MGRKATFNDPVRQVVQTSEDQHKYDTPTFRRLQINATTTNNYVTPNYVSQAGILSTALAESLPTLAVTSALVASKANEGEKARGEAARLGEVGLDPEQSQALHWYSSSDFQKGYMEAVGVEKGQIAKDKLQADWDSDPNRNNVPTNEWTNHWYKENTKGLSGDSLITFNKEVAPSLMKIANQGATEKINDVTASVYAQRYNILTKDWKDGNWSPEQAKKRQDELKLSNTDFDELQVKVLDQFARQGDNPEAARKALAVMHENRPDGTPGIAFKSNIVKTGWVEHMSTQIDQWAVAKTNAREAADKGARTEEQRKLQDSIFSTAIDKSPEAAMKQLNQARKDNPELWSPGVWMATQEKIRHIQLLKKSQGDGSGTTAQDAVLISKAIKGELGTDDIADLVATQKIKPGMAGTLMSYTTRANSMDRSQFKTPAYLRARSLLESLPSAPSSLTPDPDGSLRATMSARRQLAITSLDEELLNNPGADPNVLAQNIHKGELAFAKDASNQPYLNMYVPKYKSREEFMQALQSNTVKPGVDVKKEAQQWNWLYSQGKGK